MAYRSRHALPGGVVDVETARRAVAQVARERDAIARQLQQAQARASALERELEARDARDTRDAEQARPPAEERQPDDDRVQRLSADLANLRRHQTDAIARGIRQQTDRYLVEIASVRDSVQRALDSLPDGAAGSSPWHDGLLAVLARIDGVLQREGVHRTGAPGERFDPEVHEAIGTLDDGQEGYVRQTVSTGLVREDGSVITAAKVLVGAPSREEGT